MALTQADIARKIRTFQILRAGVTDAHGHLHAPKGHFGGRFIAKLAGALGRDTKAASGPRPLPAPRSRGPAPGAGLRGTLTAAKTTREVSSAATAEARRITGRDIPFDFTGSDPHVAREHAEGVLRGLERYPHARLRAVGLVDMSHEDEDGYRHTDWATTTVHTDGSASINFDAGYSSPTGASRYRESLAAAGERRRMGPGLTTSDPMGIALHEFGHVLAGSGPTGVNGKARQLADRVAVTHETYQHSDDPHVARAFRDLAIGHEVSVYATEDKPELTAEAFADVMAHGDDASVLSRLIADLIDDEVTPS